MLRKILLVVAVMFFTPVAFAVPTQFVQGKDYKVLPEVAQQANADGKVKVIEFFSYGCPWCFRLESSIEQWLTQKPATVDFQKVPVVFRPSWVILAKAYYTADSLGVAQKLSPQIFKAIHDKGEDLANPTAMEEFFVNHGVSKNDFDSAFNFSPAIDAKLSNGDALARQYQIFQIPTIIVGGKYMTTTAMAGGDGTRMMEIVNYLVKKANAAAVGSDS